MLLCAETRSIRCQQCARYRSSLHTYSLRQSTLSENRLESSSHTTYSSLTSSEKDMRMKNLHYTIRQGEKRIKTLKEKLEKALETRGVIDDSIADDMHKIMTDQNKNIMEEFPEGSFARLFWRQQLDAVSRKDTQSRKGMRWDPLMIKWCLYMHHKSSGAYELLQSSGCISLPSQHTHYVITLTM